MLRGIHPCISPDLLKALAEMGHGDEIVIADAHFPAHSIGKRVIRADGVQIPELLAGTLPLLPLDTYETPVVMMAPVDGDTADPAIEAEYLDLISRSEPLAAPPVHLERFAFYERARSAYVVVISGDTRPYGNVLLKKGVVTA